MAASFWRTPWTISSAAVSESPMYEMRSGRSALPAFCAASAVAKLSSERRLHADAAPAGSTHVSSIFAGAERPPDNDPGPRRSGEPSSVRPPDAAGVFVGGSALVAVTSVVTAMIGRLVEQRT